MLLPLALALAGTAGSVAAFDGVAPIPTGAAINATTTVIRTRSANLTAPVLSETRIPLAAEGVSALTFSFNNLFNTSTEPVEIEKGTLNLWSGTWDPSPLAAPLNGEFEPVKAGKVPYGFRAIVNAADPENPKLINGSFIVHPKACGGDCGNYSLGFTGFAFAMVELGNGGQEMVIQRSGSVTDDMYTEEFGSIVGEQMVYTILMRHRDCDPEGWHKCKACTCPDDPPPPPQ